MLRSLNQQNKLCFNKWTRKRYAVFSSLGKIIKIGVLCITYTLISVKADIKAQTDSIAPPSYELDEVEVIGRRSQVISSVSSRVLLVVQRDEIEKSGVHSVNDILEYVSNADVRQRGISGVQADISIRGSSFDHVMVLLNGIPLGDPQTGHYSADLPIDPESVLRIEVLEGPAARTLGPGAFMGAINIVTIQPDNEIAFTQSFGKHELLRSHFHAGFKTGSIANYLSLGAGSSGGYTENTDYAIYNAFYRAVFQNSTSKVDVQGGYQFKEFGAAGYYSPRYPYQFEETGTGFGSIGASTGNRLKFQTRVYWRRKNDHYLLDRYNPGFYENFHRTDVLGNQFNITLHRHIVTATLGFDQRSESILSNNIGDNLHKPRPVKGTDSALYTRHYQRNNVATFLEMMIQLDKLSVTGGFMLNYNSGFHKGPYFFPGIDISYSITPALNAFSSVNRALHLPTFTDLFYSDPVNQGNRDLDPNRMYSVEAGLKYAGHSIQAGASVFYNTGRDIVDWVWNYAGNRFSPLNISEFRASGLSTHASFWLNDYLPGILAEKLTINYMWLNISKSIPDSVSKYYNLRDKLSITLSQKLIENIGLFWFISYQNRTGAAIQYNHNELAYRFKAYQPYWLINCKAQWKKENIQFFVEVSNILNTQYVDAGSVLQPGRWLHAGITINYQQ